MTDPESSLIFPDECYAIQGAAFEVYRHMGHGYLEAVYQECLEKEMNFRKIHFISKPELELRYKDEPLTHTYKPDFVCYGKIIIELKAVHEINHEHEAQILNYLRVTKFRLGLLINFGAYPKATVSRFIL